jgi:hypothetical protein
MLEKKIVQGCIWVSIECYMRAWALAELLHHASFCLASEGRSLLRPNIRVIAVS